MPLQRPCSIRPLILPLAGVLGVILLLLIQAPAGAEVVRPDNRATVAPPCPTHVKADKRMPRDGCLRSASSVESAVSSPEMEAEEIEAKLVQTPGDERLLAELTRTRINVANAMVSSGAGGSQAGVEEIKQQLALAGVAWSKYLKVAKKPSPGLAILVGPALFQLAELSSNSQEALKNVKAAAAAQKIVAASRPGKNSWSTLAFYDLFAQRYNAADEAIGKAATYANTRSERESIDKRFREVEKAARQFGKRLKPR